jgi:hypothetical protein
MKNKEIEFRIPGKLNINQVAEWVAYCSQLDKKKEKGRNDIDEMNHNAMAIAIVTGADFGYILQKVDLEDLFSIGEKCLSMINKYSSKGDVDEYIKVGGLGFSFQKEVKYIPAGKVIDIKKEGEGIIGKPAYFLSKLYTPVGHNMTSQEMEVHFEKYFPADVYSSVWAFFLNSWHRRSEAISLLQIAREMNLLEEIKRYQRGGLRYTFSNWWRRIIASPFRRWFGFLTPLYYFGKSITWRSRK